MSNVENKTIKEILIALENLRKKVPLTNCITNYVTINDCANAILAIGGSPIMGDDPREIEGFIEIADALVINMGAVTKSQIEAIRIGSDYGKKTNTPIVLDPVGVGISGLRNEIILELINDSKLSSIRGNMSEIKAIMNLIDLKETKTLDKNTSKGVDVCKDDETTKENLETNGKTVEILANEINTVVIASGAIDIISDGKSTYTCENGDPLMPKITGSGCMLTSIMGAFSGANDPFISGIAATTAMGLAGENAGKIVKAQKTGPGTFRTCLIDHLYLLNEENFSNETKLYQLDA